MIILLILFFIGGIILGTVFNFGVSKNNDLNEIAECSDENCESCERYADECTLCKSKYYFDNLILKCVSKCDVLNCNECLSNFKVCD